MAGFTLALDIEEHLNCALCLSTFVNPEEISVCGHTFCKKCIARVTENAEQENEEYAR